jgi:hypothetical protein
MVITVATPKGYHPADRLGSHGGLTSRDVVAVILKNCYRDQPIRDGKIGEGFMIGRCLLCR